LFVHSHDFRLRFRWGVLTAKNVCDALLSIFAVTGLSSNVTVLSSDNGSEFCAALTRVGVSQRYITPLNPNANGLAASCQTGRPMAYGICLWFGFLRVHSLSVWNEVKWMYVCASYSWNTRTNQRLCRSVCRCVLRQLETTFKSCWRVLIPHKRIIRFNTRFGKCEFAKP